MCTKYCCLSEIALDETHSDEKDKDSDDYFFSWRDFSSPIFNKVIVSQLLMLFNTTYEYKDVCPESRVKSSRNQSICCLGKSNVDEHETKDALEKPK